MDKQKLKPTQRQVASALIILLSASLFGLQNTDTSTDPVNDTSSDLENFCNSTGQDITFCQKLEAGNVTVDELDENRTECVQTALNHSNMSMLVTCQQQ